MRARPVATLALSVALGVAVAGCGPGRGRAEREPAESAEAEVEPGSPEDAGETAEERAPSVPELVQIAVKVYFPAAAGGGLAAEQREIFETGHAADRAKQIVSEILSGPQSSQAVPVLPEGTRLRQIYVLDDGTAYADFSRELRDGLGGGSAREILAVYAVVDSLVLNVPEIRRVGILVEGEPCETLNGHLDLRRPLPADLSLIATGARGAPSEGG